MMAKYHHCFLVLLILSLTLSSTFSEETSSSTDVAKTKSTAVKAEKSEDFDFSWQKLLTLGFKIALAYFTAPSGGLDKSDSFPSQAIMGTVISAVTDIKDPEEIAVMAKQASEVFGLLESFLRALQTSFS